MQKGISLSNKTPLISTLVGISQVQMKANRDGDIVPHNTFRKLSPAEVKDYLSNIA